jgi:hypothetical protein
MPPSPTCAPTNTESSTHFTTSPAAVVAHNFTTSCIELPLLPTRQCDYRLFRHLACCVELGEDFSTNLLIFEYGQRVLGRISQKFGCFDSFCFIRTREAGVFGPRLVVHQEKSLKLGICGLFAKDNWFWSVISLALDGCAGETM